MKKRPKNTANRDLIGHDIVVSYGMENKRPLRWYNYAAKVIMICMASLVAPLLIIVALSMGDHPLAIYKDIWND